MKKLVNGRYQLSQTACVSLEMDDSFVFYVVDLLFDDIHVYNSFNEAIVYYMHNVKLFGVEPFEDE